MMLNLLCSSGETVTSSSSSSSSSPRAQRKDTRPKTDRKATVKPPKLPEEPPPHTPAKGKGRTCAAWDLVELLLTDDAASSYVLGSNSNETTKVLNIYFWDWTPHVTTCVHVTSTFWALCLWIQSAWMFRVSSVCFSVPVPAKRPQKPRRSKTQQKRSTTVRAFILSDVSTCSLVPPQHVHVMHCWDKFIHIVFMHRAEIHTARWGWGWGRGGSLRAAWLSTGVYRHLFILLRAS